MKFDIESEICLGYSHCGAVTTEGKGVLELEDDEVSVLVNLIREKNTTDVKELGLKELYPDIYDKMDDAYHHVAYKAEELHWLWEGYYNNYFECDTDELISISEGVCGFEFEYNEEDYYDEKGNLDIYAIEEDKNKACFKWLDDYVHGLSDEEAVDFFYEYMDPKLYIDDVRYKVEMPKQIIDMAKKC